VDGEPWRWSEETADVSRGSWRGRDWRPAASLHQTAHGWRAEFDLAGARSEDVRIAVSGRRLTVYGTSRTLELREDHQAWALETSYSRFERSIELPDEISRAQLLTDYRGTTLIVRVERRTL
jgi:HSP20 family molecular chaperone IbpA